MKTRKVFLLVFGIVSLGAVVYFCQRHYAGFQKAQQQELSDKKKRASWVNLQKRIKSEISQFKGEAGVVIEDLENGWVLSYEYAKLFPSASLAKIPLMAACYLAAEQKKIKLDRNISLQSTDKLSGSGVLKDMPIGSTFSVERLIGLMIYESDNTATNIITNLLGIGYLNSVFKSFGLKNTELSRKIADYQSRDKGVENYTTAQDMALLLRKIYQRNLGSRNISEQCIRMLKLTRMNDRIPKYLPVEACIAHKTGLEKGVCHDAGIIFSRQGDFLICVLTKHEHANSNPSKEFIAKLALHAYTYLANSRELVLHPGK
jgi:beta-lactamase class A